MDNAHWLSTYKDHLNECKRLVFFTTKDGWIGRGVKTEIDYALRQKMPVHRLIDNGTMIPWAKCKASMRVNTTSWVQHIKFSTHNPTTALIDYSYEMWAYFVARKRRRLFGA